MQLRLLAHGVLYIQLMEKPLTYIAIKILTFSKLVFSHMGDGIFKDISLAPCLKMGDEVPNQQKSKKNSRKGLQMQNNTESKKNSGKGLQN